MGRMKNDLVEEIKNGKPGKNVIVKNYSYGTVISAYPDMSNVKLSQKQKMANNRFKEAVAYAKSIIQDPNKRHAYEQMLAPGKTVYHTALSEYLKNNP